MKARKIRGRDVRLQKLDEEMKRQELLYYQTPILILRETAMHLCVSKRYHCHQ